jgi:hypothetical protein
MSKILLKKDGMLQLLVMHKTICYYMWTLICNIWALQELERKIPISRAKLYKIVHMKTTKDNQWILVRPPRPWFPTVFPSREEFARTYYLGTPVSSLPNHLLPLSCYMAKFLTLAQTCREPDVPATDPFVMPLARRVCHVRSHQLMLVVVLLVLLMVRPLVVLQPRYANVRRCSRAGRSQPLGL